MVWRLASQPQTAAAGDDDRPLSSMQYDGPRSLPSRQPQEDRSFNDQTIGWPPRDAQPCPYLSQTAGRTRDRSGSDRWRYEFVRFKWRW